VTSDLRVARAERILDAHGIAAAVSIAGHEDDVIAIQADISKLKELRALAPELKGLGFRYVALELDTEELR
jgi:NAD(P)-dependent dehydrogenase (short-subunit alcohol dehydrogenase family)